MNQVITLLADSRLHLPLYDALIQEKGNLSGIQVFSLNTFLQRNLRRPARDNVSLLFQYKDLLEQYVNSHPNRPNLFAGSIKDFDFLQSCLDFLGLTQSYGTSSFPEDSQKEKDLKIFLDLLNSVPLWQKEAAALSFENMESVYLLGTPHSQLQQHFTKKLLEAGAHSLVRENLEEKFYWSASNIRKAIQAAAKEILEKDYEASDIQIVLANEKDRYVFEQIFKTHHIPFTFLDNPSRSRVLEQFLAALEYVIEKDQDHLIALLKALYPKTSRDVVEYLELFDGNSHMEDLIWKENPVLDEKEFERLQSLEAQARSWDPVLETLQSWNLHSVGQIAAEIQLQIPEPAKEDIKTMDAILNAYALVKDSIRDKEDLKLFTRYLETLSVKQSLESMEGVIVGGREILSPLRPIVFYIGADASNYPGNPLQRGLFDEAYLSKMDLPALSERLKAHKENLEASLKQAKVLYMITAQSDYEGKSIERPVDLDTFMNMPVIFQPVHDPYLKTRPEFELEENAAFSVFQKDGVLNFGINALETFQACPFKHYLRYGLHLHSRGQGTPSLEANASLIDLMVRHFAFVQKDLKDVTYQDLLPFVEKQFSLVRQVFVNKQKRIDLAVSELALKLENIAHTLARLDAYNLQLFNQPYRMLLEKPENEMPFVISGALYPSNFYQQAFTLFDADEPVLDPQLLPQTRGALRISLSDAPIETAPYQVRYARAASPKERQTRQLKKPTEIEEVTFQQEEARYHKQSLRDSLKILDLDQEKHPAACADFNFKKPMSIRSHQENYENLARLLSHSIQKGQIQPVHTAGACERCSYRPICRNGSSEKEKAKA